MSIKNSFSHLRVKVGVLAFLAILLVSFSGFNVSVAGASVGAGELFDVRQFDFDQDVSVLPDENALYGDFDSKLSPTLLDWLDKKTLPSFVNYMDEKVSVLMLVKGDDPSLGGVITPLGAVELMDGAYYVHTTVTDAAELAVLAANPNILKIEADFSRVEKGKGSSVHEISTAEVQKQYYEMDFGEVYDDDVITDTVETREVLRAEDTWALGYDGTGYTAQIHDSGVDFGHTALQDTMAVDPSGFPTSLNPSGQLSISALWSKNYWESYGYPSPEFAPQNSSASGTIDVTGWQNLLVFLADMSGLYTASAFFGVMPLEWNVNGLPGNETGYVYGISGIHNGGWLQLVPFVLADADDDAEFDTLYVDYEGGYNMTESFYAPTYDEADWIMGNTTIDFTDEVAHTNYNNLELSKDIRDPTSMTPDGKADISLGGIANTYDVNDFLPDEPIVRGIVSDGSMFAHMWDAGGHGTGCAGHLGARATDYPMLATDPTLYTLEGIAPDAKILATNGLSQTDTLYGWLWAAGFEPDENMTWSFVPDCGHIVNVSSNSWGYSYMELGGIALGWDFETMFIDMLSMPGFLHPDYPGVLYLTSSGNGGPGLGTSKQPGQSTAALTVGASTTNWWRGDYGYDATLQGNDQVIGWSDNGPTVIGYPKLDIVAPGAFDFSTQPVLLGGNYDWSDYYFFDLFGGTSASCPVTAGAMGLVYDAWDTAYPGVPLTPDMAKVILKSTATDLGYDPAMQGGGRVDPYRAAQYIEGAGDDLAQDVLIAYSLDATKIAAQRYELSFWENFMDGVEEEDPGVATHPLLNGTYNYADNAIYGGTLMPGDSATNMVMVEGTADALTVEPYTFQTTYTAVNDTLRTNNGSDPDFVGYSVWKLEDLFDITELRSADYFQLVFSVSLEDGFAIRDLGQNPPYMYISSLEAGNAYDDTANWTFWNYAYGDNNFQSVYLPTDFIQSGMDDVYVRIRDRLYPVDGSWTGVDFQMSVRAFTRVVDTAVSIDMGVGYFNATITAPVDAAPGMYEGYVMVSSDTDNHVMVPLGYSVAADVESYMDAGWTEIVDGTLTDRPFDNGFYGCADWSWRAETGDWRFYDVIINHTERDYENEFYSMAFEVEWTNPGTELNMWVVDHSGYVVAQTEYETLNGRYLSDINAPETKQRLLVEARYYSWDIIPGSYPTATGYGWDQFTIVVHANQMNATSATLPLEPFKLKMTWLNQTVYAFDEPELTLAGHGYESNGKYYTTGDIEATWSEVATNPIPEFSNTGTMTHLSVSPGDVTDIEDTITADEIVPYSAAIVPERTYDVFLTAGDYVVGDLDWSDSTDFDFLIIPYGAIVDFDSCIFGAMGGSSAHPEHFEGIVPATGWYTLIIEYFDGPMTDVDFHMTFSVLGPAIAELEAPAGTMMSVDLLSLMLTEGNYIVSTSASGWNFGRTGSGLFVLDTTAPNTTFTDYLTTFNNNTSGSFTFEIEDIIPGVWTCSLDGVEFASGEYLAGKSHDTVFKLITVPGQHEISVEATDALGNTSTETITVTVIGVEPEEPEPEEPEPEPEDGGFIPGFTFNFFLLAAVGTTIVLLKRKR